MYAATQSLNAKQVTELIGGYVHEIEKQVVASQNHIIPCGIINLIIKYFIFKENFKIRGDDIHLLNKKHANKIENPRNNWSSALGSFIIEPNKFPAIYSWNFCFKLSSSSTDTTSSYIAVGIIEYSNDDEINLSQCIYQLLSRHNAVKCYALYPIYTNDADNRITMILDCQEKLVNFYINNVADGLTWRNIDISKRYRLAVSLVCASVEITHSSIDFVSNRIITTSYG